ncbi:hypothetical protein ABN763_07960 [Spongiivirga sp. MCCC 1A20706]|uniref:hypothetical protein n=1 Tax=Spongiivirga sp. MCCC 1A20706 TaxID=3160963 RepID=UPI003977DE1D
MKRNVFTLLLLTIGFITNAQIINNVPGLVASQLDNGWYKYQSEGATFDVEVKDGYIIRGNIKWFNEDTYSGSLSLSSIAGKGTYTWANGERYEGAFKKNQRHGKGSMYYVNGEKFSGKWKKDKRHGKGKIWKTDGSIVTGVWENGVLVSTK